MATPVRTTTRTPPKDQRRETNDERKRRENKEKAKLQRRLEPRAQQQRRKQKTLKSRSPVKQQSTRGLGGWLRPRASPKMGSAPRGASLQEKNLAVKFKTDYQTSPPSAVNDMVIVYFTKNKQVLKVRSKKSTEPPLSYENKTPALATMGKVIQASPNSLVVIFKKPKARFENRMAQGKSSGAGISTGGGVPLFALLDANMIDPEGKILPTNHPGNVGAHVQVYFDRKTGEYKEKSTSPYDYVGFGKIMKKTEFSKQPEYNSKGVVIPGREGKVSSTGKILVVPPTVKLMIYRSAKDRKVGDKKGVYVGGKPPLEKKPGEKNNKSPPKFVDPSGARPDDYPGATRLDGTIVEAQKTSSGETLYTVSYVEPRKTTSGQYVPRYDIFNNAGMLKTDPRYIQAMKAEQRLAIAQEKPPICSTRLDFSTRDNCFSKNIDARVVPAMDELAKYSGSAGKGNPACNGLLKLMPHQIVIYEYAKILANPALAPVNARGLLCFHSVGSGKTASALAAALAFWDAIPKKRIVLATTRNNADDNSAAVYITNLFKYFPDKSRQIYGDKKYGLQDFVDDKGLLFHDASGYWNEKKFEKWFSIDNPNKLGVFTDRVKVESFTTLANAIGFAGGRGKPEGPGYLIGKHGPPNGKTDKKYEEDGGILIMDEVQSLFKPRKNEIKEGHYLAKQLLTPQYRNNCFMMCFTGTPGDTPDDLLKIVNFVRPSNVEKMTLEDFRKESVQRSLYGCISYVDIQKDTSRFPIMKTENIVKTMDNKYYMAYLNSLSAITGGIASKIGDERGPSYMSAAITAGDVITTDTALKGVYTPAEIQSMENERIPRAIQSKSGATMVFSPKFVELISRVKSIGGKQYIYVKDKKSIVALLTMFKKMGYDFIKPGSLTKEERIVNGKTESVLRRPQIGKNVMLYLTGTISIGNAKYDYNKTYLTLQKDLLKMDPMGEIVQIIIASGTYYQGLSIDGLSAVHICDVVQSLAADIQAFGRGPRMCGHRKVPYDKVYLFRYFTAIPRSFTPPEKPAAKAKKLTELNKYLQTLPLGIPKEAQASGFLEAAIRPPDGVNGFVYAQGVREGYLVKMMENVLKAQSIDCDVFRKRYHRDEPFECGKFIPLPYLGKASAETSTVVSSTKLNTGRASQVVAKKSPPKTSSGSRSPKTVLVGGSRGSSRASSRGGSRDGSRSGSRGGSQGSSSRGSSGSKIAPSFDPVSFSTLAKDAQRSSQGSSSRTRPPQQDLKRSPVIGSSKSHKSGSKSQSKGGSKTASKAQRSLVSPQRASQLGLSPRSPPKAPMFISSSPKTQTSPQRTSQLGLSPRSPPKTPMFVSSKSPPKPTQSQTYAPRKATNLVKPHAGVKFSSIDAQNRAALDKMKSRTR